jgi:hypothetical protein
MVTVAGLLVWPTPVVGKSIADGVTAMPAATAPVPLRGTVAEVAIEGEATLNAPVAGPVTVGAKAIPTVQVEPAARVDAQVFCTMENAEVTESASWLAAMLLVLLTVIVCAGLEEPTVTAPKASCAGLTLRPEATFPAPFSGTEIELTPRVADEIINVAVLPPAAVGEKITCTVQLAPPVNTAVQVVVPVEKLAAEAPVIWKPTLAAEAPPLLVMVRRSGVPATPTFWTAKVRLTGLTTSVAGCTPVPDSDTVCVRWASETVSKPGWMPIWIGAKTTWMLQAECPASCVPQSLEV